MFIQTEPTPNPATLKFIPGQVVLADQTADFPSADDASGSALALRIFAVGDVRRVFLGHDFISVTKSASVRWDQLKPAIMGAIAAHLQSGEAVLDTGEGAARRVATGEGAAGDAVAPDDAVIARIRELLETRVRPAVALDGGDIAFRGFADGIVFLHMQGACAGCPSSAMTLKMGIENLLRHYVPSVVEVRSVPV